LSPVTNRIEVMSLSAVWHCVRHSGIVFHDFPGRGLVYSKGKEKPPFQTWEEIERKAVGLSRD
jgi:hypothetical protein